MPRTPPAPALLFADGFGATVIDARGKVRARALAGPCFAFDAKSARLAVVGAGGALTLLDAALRSGREVYHAAGALLPDGSPVYLTRRDGALGLDRGDATTWRALPAAPEALEVSLGPETQPPDHGFFVHTCLADDGGISLAHGRDERLFGVLDPDDLTVRDPVRVRLRPSQGSARAFLPGASWHVLVEHRRATDTVTALSVAAGGALRRCTFPALALPARDGHTLWAQSDDATVVQHTLDGAPLASLSIPAEHRGAGTIFVQHLRPWFVPWHGDAVIDLREGRVFDRALPGDPALRRHVAETLRRLHPLARAAGLGLHVASLHTRGGAKPFAQMSLWSDGGDLGTLAHCVQGAAMDWAKCAEVPAGEGLLSTGGSVTAAREADVRELLAALDALDAHALPLRASAQHWATMYRTPGARAFDDEAGALFARLLVDPTLRVGAQGACARALQATPFDVDRWQQHRAACAQSPEGMNLAQLSRAVMARHSPPGALPPMDRLVR
jgi:hypothetical protein